MKIHKLSILGGLLGATIIICSIIQWFFRFNDPSQLIFGLSIGVIVCAFTYIYNWMKEQDRDTQKTNKRLDAFTEWWVQQEME